MNIRYLYLLMIFCITIVSASAITTTDNIMYLDFDSNTNDASGNANHAILGEATHSTSVKAVGAGSYQFDGINDYMNIPIDFSTEYTTSDPWTLNLWFKSGTTSGTKWLYGTENYNFVYFAGTDLKVYVFGTIASIGAGYNDDNWHMVTFGYDGSNGFYSVNGSTKTTFAAGSNNADTNTRIGARGGATPSLYVDAYIDEVSQWSRSLSNSDISDLYNSGSGFNPYNVAAASPKFQITLKDEYNSGSILEFNVTIDSTNYQTTNGTIVTHLYHNDTNTYDIYVNANDYFSNTFNSVETSSNYVANLFQSQVGFQATELITGNLIAGNFNTTTNSTTSELYMNAGIHAVTFTPNNNSYFVKHGSINISPYFNGTKTITGVYSTLLNITVQNAYTGQNLTDFSGWIYNSVNSWNYSFSSVSELYQIGLINGNYQIYVENSNYAIGNNNYNNITISENYQSTVFNLWSDNSIRVNIYDSDGIGLITDLVEVTISGNSGNSYYNTTSGMLFLEDLLDGNYTLTFSGQNFTTISYTVTVADRSTQILNAYLSETSSNSVILTAKDDDSGSVIEGVSVSIAKEINNSWTVIETKETDITGRVLFYYTPDLDYRFTFTHNNYQDKVFELNPILFDSYNVRMEKSIAEYDNRDYADISITHFPKVFYNDENNDLTIVFSDPDGSLTSYGINITYPDGFNSSSGTNSYGESLVTSFKPTESEFLDVVDIVYYYDTTLGEQKEFKLNYYIQGSIGNSTFMHNRDETYGFGILERALIATLGTILVVGAATFFGGALAGGLLGLFILGFFTYLNFLPWWGTLIATVVGFMLLSWRSNQ